MLVWLIKKEKLPLQTDSPTPRLAGCTKTTRCISCRTSLVCLLSRPLASGLGSVYNLWQRVLIEFLPSPPPFNSDVRWRGGEPTGLWHALKTSQWAGGERVADWHPEGGGGGGGWLWPKQAHVGHEGIWSHSQICTPPGFFFFSRLCRWKLMLFQSLQDEKGKREG